MYCLTKQQQQVMRGAVVTTTTCCPACLRPLPGDVAAVSLFCNSMCRRAHTKRAKLLEARQEAKVGSFSLVPRIFVNYMGHTTEAKPCKMCRTPTTHPRQICSIACRAYNDYIDGARYWAAKIGQRQGGFVRVDTIEVKA